MSASVVRLGEAHVEGIHAVLDSVAREERYLAMLQAPPLEEVRKFVNESVAKERPQLVALADQRPVGWCDVIEKPRDALKHSGTLAGLCRRHMRVRGEYHDSYFMAWLC